MSSEGRQKKKVAILAVAIISLFLLSGFQVLYHHPTSVPVKNGDNRTGAMTAISFIGSINPSSENYTGQMQVLVMFNFSNQAGLSQLLLNLSNPFSPQYGKFLSESQFNAEFAPSLTTYNSAVNYFRQYGINVREEFQNRAVLSLDGSSSNFSNAFNTTITASQGSYGPSSQPQLPQWLAGSVNNVVGLTSAKPTVNLNLVRQGAYVSQVSQNSNVTASQYIYPKMPALLNGAQLLYGSYFQVAYNETPLLEQVMPSGAVIASILWGGSYQSGSSTVYTAPYNPADISTYFNQSLPSSQPKPHIYGVPVNGALAPGASSQKDTSGAAVENTLDMEMLGSTAPGASIYNVYGKNSTIVDLTTALETILSPGVSQPAALKNVSVISNSWGSTDFVSQTWNQLLKESQARGITVLASSGDSGNDLNSPKSVSPTEATQFPSTVAYNTYGVVAVGGTNVTLSSSTFALQKQEVWYQPDTPSNGGTLGSVGGISQNYTTPSWQLSSQANQVINDRGRGVPDVAAVANNTLIYYSNTTKGSYYIVGGTSVAAPVLAGIVAEMDHYRTYKGEPWLGFLNPSIYQLGTEQYDPALTGGYTPNRTPFYDVYLGHNYQYSALHGYDLVTGMGSIDAYNFLSDLTGKKYNVSFQESGLQNGTAWSVEVEGNSTPSSGNYVNFSLINGSYHYSVPTVGNFVSDPVAGNFTVHGGNVTVVLQFKRGYSVTFSQNELPQGEGWSITSWNYTASTLNRSMALLFPNGTYNYSVTSSDLNYYGGSGNFTMTGSAISIAVNFTHGIFNITFIEEGLPASHLWSVNNGTLTKISNTTNITFTSLGGPFTFTILPTGKYIANHTSISLNTNGANQTVYLNFSYGYFITFNETGVPAGASWSVVIADYNISSTNNTITVELQNGTYGFYASYSYLGSKQHISSNVNVTGSNVTVNLNFTVHRTISQYYVLYVSLFVLGLAVLVIGLLMLRKR